jgi:hypothetical protein
MAEPLRHRQTKEAATDMFSLQQPRHIPTLPRRDELDASIPRPLVRSTCAIGLQIQMILNASTIGEIDAAFATLARERPDAIFVAEGTVQIEPREFAFAKSQTISLEPQSRVLLARSSRYSALMFASRTTRPYSSIRLRK